MKKRLYDFSKSNAIIVTLAYIMLLILDIFSLSRAEEVGLAGIIFTSVFILSYTLIIIFFVVFSVKVDSEGVKHRNKFIRKEDLEVYVRPNYLARYNEIIFRSKKVYYKKLSKKEIKKKEITVRYFPKYEDFIKEYLNIEKIQAWS